MSNTIITPNREDWLQKAVQSLRPLFLGHGYTIPELRVSIGWPSSGGLGKKKRTVGQCWFGATAADGKPQIFVSPLHDNNVTYNNGVLATLVHEVCHVAAGADAKHGPKFKKVADKMGLEGKPTSTIAGEDLIARFGQMVMELGPFDHAALVPVKENKPQTTRMRKCECEACGFLVRLTQKWLDVGQPICPAPGHGPMKADLPKGDEDDGGEE